MDLRDQLLHVLPPSDPLRKQHEHYKYGCNALAESMQHCCLISLIASTDFLSVSWSHACRSMSSMTCSGVTFSMLMAQCMYRSKYSKGELLKGVKVGIKKAAQGNFAESQAALQPLLGRRSGDEVSPGHVMATRRGMHGVPSSKSDCN